MDAKAGSLSPNISASLTGEQVSVEQATFNHIKEVHSEKEKPWFTWLNITVTIVMTILGALSLGDHVYGSVAGLVISFIFILCGKCAKNKGIDVTISSR